MPAALQVISAPRHQYRSDAVCLEGSPSGMSRGHVYCRLDHGLKSNPDARSGGRVVLDFVQQLDLGFRQEANRAHRATARALAKTSSAGTAVTVPLS